jgi:hypothetical protein
MISAIIAAGGGIAMWSAGGVMEVDGPEAGMRLLRIGQWIVALAIAACGLVWVVHKSRGTPDAFVGGAGW